MKHAVLCVDDDASILEGYRRVLGQRFELYLARGPFQGIEKLESGPEYSVAVVDMRMPEMNGIEFLKRVQVRSPQTRRIMLSGDAEQSTAVDAVNQGHVSAYLAKPCPSQALLAAVQAAADEWEAQAQERAALRKAQAGALRALLEMLKAADPALHARCLRVRSLGERLLAARGLGMDWQMEASLLLSQAACLYLRGDIRAKRASAEALSGVEEMALEGHVPLGAAWLQGIPGYEGIAQAIAAQRKPYRGADPAEELQGPALPLASRVACLAADWERYSAGDRPVEEVRSKLHERWERYDPELLAAALALRLRPERDGIDPSPLRAKAVESLVA